jgi:hypothetical protein
MPSLSLRVVVPVAALVVAWGGLQLLTSHRLEVSPGAVPSAPATATSPGVLPSIAPRPSPTGSGTGEVPILPGALRELNGATRDTAVGMYALLRELENALRRQLERLARNAGRGG